MKALVLVLAACGMLAWASRAAAAAPEGAAPAPTPAAPAEHTYKKTPQGDLKMVIHTPPGWTASDRRPAIVFFFGGAWRSGTIGQFADQASYLASRGMVAALADYRVRARHGTSPVECAEDARSAVRWLRRKAGELGIDPARLAAAGGSAGGHIAACAALAQGPDAPGEDTAVSARPDALVLFNPVLDLVGLESHVEGLDEAARRRISPVLHLGKDAPPAVLFYGTADRFLAHGRAMRAKARQAGNRVDLWTADAQPHAFFNRPPWKELTLREADRFLASLGYLEGEPTVALPPAATQTLTRED